MRWTSGMMDSMDERADWEGMWTSRGVDLEDIRAEESTLRWAAIESAVAHQFLGGFDKLKVVEIGSGHGTNAFQFVRRGATAMLLDNSPAALHGAEAVAEQIGVEATFEEADIFGDTSHLDGKFDVCCSFGLAEHFTGEARQRAIDVHLRLIRLGGLAIISVPNRWSAPYRMWMGAQRLTGRWPYGTEVPFTRGEMERLIAAAGGTTVSTAYGSFSATVVNYLGRPLLRRTRRASEHRTPLDPWAYDMTLFATR